MRKSLDEDIVRIEQVSVANLAFPWFSIMFKVTVMLAPAAAGTAVGAGAGDAGGGGLCG